MGIFSDDERGELDFEQCSETSSNVDEREAETGPVGQVPPATGNAFDQIDTSSITPPAALLAFVEGCCEEFKLSDAAKEDAMRTAGLPSIYMTMRLYTRALAMGQDATKTQVEDFLRSNTFKESIKRRIQGGLLDPNIPYYVRGCTARFVRHIKQNPVSYEIPKVIQERLLTTKKFSSAVGEILSSFRGELRRKIFGSIEDKSDIASTGEKLAIQGYQLSEDHLKQFALLRRLSEDYINAEAKAQAKKAMENANGQTGKRGRGNKKNIDGAPQKALAFWTYIDTQMSRFQKYSDAKRSDFVKNVLRKDRKKYPDPTGQTRWFPPANQLIVSQWQADASHAVQVMAKYTLTAAQEGHEVLQAGPGATDEDEGPDNREEPPEEEEDGTLGGDEDDQSMKDGTGRASDFQEDPSTPFNEDEDTTHTSTHHGLEDRQILTSGKTAPARPHAANLGNVHHSLQNNDAPGNHTPQRIAPQGHPSSVGQVRGTPGLQGGRVTTLAQASRGSPFPSSSRTSIPQASRTPASGVPKGISNGGPQTQSKAGAQRLPDVDSYNPVDSETAAASVSM